MAKRTSILAACFAAVLPFNAMAQDAVLTAAFEAASDDDWEGAYGLVGVDLVARDVVTWERLRRGEGEFLEYIQFIDSHEDWPTMTQLRARAEEAMANGAENDVVVSFFDGEDPQTGTGALFLVRALVAAGESQQAAKVLSDTWETYGLTDDEHAQFVEAFGSLLEPWHWKRTENMLWRWKTTDARRMLPLLDDDHRALAEARIALISKSGNIDELVDAVPASLADDPGLAYDQFNYLSDQGERTLAIEILNNRTDSAATLAQPFRWSGWRRSHARWEMREGRYDSAYRLASKHFLSPDEGEPYADLEWLAGYVALRFLDDPRLALEHFRKLEAAVDSPISDGRAGYWLGRAYEAAGDPEMAAVSYREGAEHQTAFYGLLASEKANIPLDPSIAGNETFPAYEGSDLADNDVVKAAFMLLDAGERGKAVSFFAELGRTLDREQLGTIGQELMTRDDPFFLVLLGKSAAARGIIIPDLYFPLHDLANMDLPVEPELALSIARRESEFNPVVGSSVGALGLMQLMPGTAQDVANDLGIDYSKPRLTSDWQYNATLGSRYLEMLEEMFGNTPIMIAAGYNAGPGRSRDWAAQRGDPRKGEVDPIDWVEMIPFRETRNYVMRVTESIPVYQARLSGEVGPVNFTSLLIGNTPMPVPRARPWNNAPN